MLRRLIATFLILFFIVLVLFPVLLGGMFITSAAEDQVGSAVFRALLLANLSILGSVTLLLIGTLAAITIINSDDETLYQGPFSDDIEK